ISGFRNWHQIPFLKAMPDREVILGNVVMIGDGDYVGVTSWPGMQMTISGDGWLGIAPSNQTITMRSLDFWRCENGLIRENWVLVDLLQVYDKLGVDVFSRMREMTYACQQHA
ncbi:MAG: ester cyclase, partial [Anaerolineales bacterium]|nr:ester cyclase [Anaerolineales bacterium]